MIANPMQGVGLVLVAVAAVALFLTLRRLRAVPARSIRSKWIGGLVPIAATAAYVYLANPPYSVTVLAAAAVVGTVLGLVLGRSGGRPMSLESHQRGIALLVWSMVFLLAALSGLTAYGGLQAIAAVAVTAAAGLALGVQLGVLARPRTRSNGPATLGITAALGLLLAMGSPVGAGVSVVGQPDPCTFMDVSIWPGPLLEDPGILRGGDLARPSCTAGFVYDTDEAGFILVGTLTVIQLPTELEARASVDGAGAILGQASVELGDGGVEGVYVEGSEELYAAYFSVHNYIGWVKGPGYSDQRIQQGRAAASRLAELMKAAVAAVLPTPSPAPTAASTPTPTPSATAPVASAGTETAAPATPAPTAAPSGPLPGVDVTAVLAQLETVGASLTLGAPVNAQIIENTLQGIGAALAVLVLGLVLARFGGRTPAPAGGTANGGSTAASGKGSATPVEPVEPEEAPLARWPADEEPLP